MGKWEEVKLEQIPNDQEQQILKATGKWEEVELKQMPQKHEEKNSDSSSQLKSILKNVNRFREEIEKKEIKTFEFDDSKTIKPKQSSNVSQIIYEANNKEETQEEVQLNPFKEQREKNKNHIKEEIKKDLKKKTEAMPNQIEKKSEIFVQKGGGRLKCPKCGNVKRNMIREEQDTNHILYYYPLIYGKKYNCGQCGTWWRIEYNEE